MPKGDWDFRITVNKSALLDPSTNDNIPNFDFHRITATQLATEYRGFCVNIPVHMTQAEAWLPAR